MLTFMKAVEHLI